MEGLVLVGMVIQLEGGLLVLEAKIQT